MQAFTGKEILPEIHNNRNVEIAAGRRRQAAHHYGGYGVYPPPRGIWDMGPYTHRIFRTVGAEAHDTSAPPTPAEPLHSHFAVPPPLPPQVPAPAPPQVAPALPDNWNFLLPAQRRYPPTLSPTAVPPHATPQPTAPLRAAGARRATAGGRSSSARTRRACRRGSRACRPSWS